MRAVKLRAIIVLAFSEKPLAGLAYLPLPVPDLTTTRASVPLCSLR